MINDFKYNYPLETVEALKEKVALLENKKSDVNKYNVEKAR